MPCRLPPVSTPSLRIYQPTDVAQRARASRPVPPLGCMVRRARAATRASWSLCRNSETLSDIETFPPRRLGSVMGELLTFGWRAECVLRSATGICKVLTLISKRKYPVHIGADVLRQFKNRVQVIFADLFDRLRVVLCWKMPDMPC